jgi:hypothetical protein
MLRWKCIVQASVPSTGDRVNRHMCDVQEILYSSWLSDMMSM